MKDFNVGVGSRIKEKRLSLHLTRDKLADLAKISDKFLYDIELGRKGMSAVTLHKIAQALGVSADWLLDGCEHNQAENKLCVTPQQISVLEKE